MVVVLEVVMHMRRAKKRGDASQPITNKLTQPEIGVAAALCTLNKGFPHHIQYSVNYGV